MGITIIVLGFVLGWIVTGIVRGIISKKREIVEDEPKPEPKLDAPIPTDQPANPDEYISSNVEEKIRLKWKRRIDKLSNCEIINGGVFHLPNSRKTVCTFRKRCSFEELLEYINQHSNEHVYINMVFSITRGDLWNDEYDFPIWHHSMIKLITQSGCFNSNNEFVSYSPKYTEIQDAYDNVIFNNMSEIVSVLPPPQLPPPSPSVQRIKNGDTIEIWVGGELITSYKEGIPKK
jgi:hypothetical protein